MHARSACKDGTRFNIADTVHDTHVNFPSAYGLHQTLAPSSGVRELVLEG